RPVRIAVVPISAFGELPGAAALYLDDPKMRAPVVKPTRVVEFVGNVFVVAHVAAIAVFRAGVAGADPTYDYQACSVGRPAKDAHSIFQIRDSSGLTAIHREQVNLIARLLGRI